MTAPQNDAELRKILKELERRQKYRRMDFFEPYPKQAEFFKLGASYAERMFFAGNQLGKSEAGAFESACHLTGHYPDWWEGRRWDRPTRGWCCGVTSLAVRDVSQKKLCGEPGVDDAFGTGMIPKEFFVDKPSMARGITDAYDTIQVRHKSGGISVARFKSYEQGRAKFQGETLDWIWPDEEPDAEIYLECVTRLTRTNGMIFTTFTPLQGKTPLVCRFMDEDVPDRVMLTMTIDDVPLTEEERTSLLSKYPAHLRKAKLYGVPLFGEGLVFDVPEEMVRESGMSANSIPSHWAKLWSIDFGIGHPFGAVLNAWDKDADVIHVLHAFKMKDARPVDHARAMKPFGEDIWVAWPRDGTNREAGSGKPLANYYRDEGLKMVHEHATWEDGGISTEAGVAEMLDRMKDGRYKVAAHLTPWWEEFRTYHRKDGQIVKTNDDIMSASRVGVMAKRFARPGGVNLIGRSNTRRHVNVLDRGLKFARAKVLGRA